MKKIGFKRRAGRLRPPADQKIFCSIAQRFIFCYDDNEVIVLNLKYPVRKHVRLAGYDYRTPGIYYITICSRQRIKLFSHIVWYGNEPDVELLPFGIIAKEELEKLTNRFPFVTLDNYVIMPNHIHIIVGLNCLSPEDQLAPLSITGVIGMYKSLVTRRCKKITSDHSIFQTSFYEHIVRNQKEYQEIYKYISDNPRNWQNDELWRE